MMTSAVSVFVVQLARASRKSNYLIRNLGRADRDDILATAILWCWENRHNYSLTTTLDTWFVNAVKDALKAWRRGEARERATHLSDIPTSDTTSTAVEAAQAAEVLIHALPPEYKKVARLQIQGYTWLEMVEQGIKQRTVDEARARIKQLRRLLPDDRGYKRALYRAAQDGAGRATSIDHDIARLEAMPKHGKDCPPCWRCKYFEGYLPGEYTPIRMSITDPEVRDAVRDTEARKIEIAERVRHGCV